VLISQQNCRRSFAGVLFILILINKKYNFAPRTGKTLIPTPPDLAQSSKLYRQRHYLIFWHQCWNVARHIPEANPEVCFSSTFYHLFASIGFKIADDWKLKFKNLVLDSENISFALIDTLYTRGGQTCSMYEPHIVKPKLQRAAT